MKLTASILVDKLSLFLAFLKVQCEHAFTKQIQSGQCTGLEKKKHFNLIWILISTVEIQRICWRRKNLQSDGFRWVHLILDCLHHGFREDVQVSESKFWKGVDKVGQTWRSRRRERQRGLQRTWWPQLCTSGRCAICGKILVSHHDWPRTYRSVS